MERRKFTRVEFETTAAVKSTSAEATGKVKDLSLNGMYLSTPDSIGVNQQVEIMIYLSGSSSEIFIKLRGSVIRQNEDGLGIQFEMEKIDIDALTLLRHVLAYNSKDDDQVLKEYCDFLDRREKDSE
ncbi:MAG: PilZ domain-containing protein [Deltaproteobacteria bacterium]|nr:PilZ domain-containing protein [Deltaproteobacteria bacterium]